MGGARGPHVMQYAVAAAATKRLQMMTNAGSSLAHWFFVCLWYDVCRYLYHQSRHSGGRYQRY